MRVEINTNTYEFEHGCRPRGEGLWIFCIYCRDKTTKRFEFFGTYAESKRAAVQQARAIRATEVEVMP